MSVRSTIVVCEDCGATCAGLHAPTFTIGYAIRADANGRAKSLCPPCADMTPGSLSDIPLEFQAPDTDDDE